MNECWWRGNKVFVKKKVKEKTQIVTHPMEGYASCAKLTNWLCRCTCFVACVCLYTEVLLSFLVEEEEL